MKEIFKAIDQNKEYYIEILERFCSQPSISATNIGMKEMASMVFDEVEKLGAKVEYVETSGYPIIYGEINNGSAVTLTFYNHYDVQPPEPMDMWETPPFNPSIRDGKMFARGVADNKGSFLSRVCAVDAYLKKRAILPCNIKFIVEGEEEVGSPNLDQFRLEHPDMLKTDAIIWEGGSKDINRGPLQITTGFKGLCYIELRCRTAKTDVHSYMAGIVPSAAWRLLWALDTIKDANDRIEIEGFYDGIKKASEDEKKMLERMPFDESSFKKSYGLNKYVNEMSGAELKEKLIFEPTANIAGFSTGYEGKGGKAIVPSFASCKMDFRLVKGQKAEDIAQMLRKHLDKRGFEDIEVIELSHKNPYRADVNSRIVQVALKNAELVYGMKPTVYPNSPGTTAMGTLCGPDNIPAVSFGIDHMESKIHAPNENIYIEDFINGIKMTAAVMHDFGNEK